MAALWNAADLSAWELDDAAHAFYTTSGTGGLSSTPSWGETDKAAPTHCSAKECAHVAELRAALARKTVEAIKPREELSVVPDFPFAPEEDSFWKALAPFASAKIDPAGAYDTEAEGEESDGGEDVFAAGPGLMPGLSDGMLEPEACTPKAFASFLEESAALGSPFDGSVALWAPEPPGTVEHAPAPTRKRSRGQDVEPLALPAPADEEASVPRKARGSRSGRRPAAAGGGGRTRWTPEEDAVLRVAVAENRGSVNNRSTNGIKWMKIQKRATAEYPALLRHLPADITKTGSKVLSKRWCQYVNPADQKNKARKWR